MRDPSSWKFNTRPCPKTWPHPSHRWTKAHKPGVKEAVRCPGVEPTFPEPMYPQGAP